MTIALLIVSALVLLAALYEHRRIRRRLAKAEGILEEFARLTDRVRDASDRVIAQQHSDADFKRRRALLTANRIAPVVRLADRVDKMRNKLRGDDE